MAEHILANRHGIGLVLALLIAQGAACDQCGHGTRATSKRWAKCKKCGARVQRRSIEAAEALLSESRPEPADPYEGGEG